MKTVPRGLTFDDVYVIPRYAAIMPADVDVTTRFSRNVPLNAPLSSSPMDTVTDHRLAIEIARNGGIGIIHRHIPIEQQCEEVRSVKRHMSTIITDPYTLTPRHTFAHALALMQEKEISGIPIVDGNGRLVGIVTGHDLQFETRDHSTPLDEIMTKNHLITAPIGITPSQAQALFHETHVEKLLLVDHDFMLCGLMTLKDTKKKIMFPRATLCARGQLRVGAAVGATGDFLERACALRDVGVDVIVIDASHGHSLNVGIALDKLKANVGIDVVAGNIATAEGARFLYEHGADAIRVGIGPASICTTRVVAGIGVPQISAIQWATESVNDAIPIIADGGIQYSGDITKAIAAGASSVMIGSLFAGTDESPGEEILYKGRAYKKYRGMGSEAVLQSGGDRYGSKAVPEGVEGIVPSKGPFVRVFDYLVGGLRQGMGYAGCANIEQLRHDTMLIEMTDAGRKESHVHDVIITNEPPNYQIQ